MKNFLIGYCIFLLASSCGSRKHSDTGEINLHGRVKKMTVLFYTKLEKKEGEWKISSPEDWLLKQSASYNKEGMVEKLEIVQAPINEGGKTDTTVIVFYNKNTRNRNGMRYDGRGNVKGSLKQEWLDDLHYITSAYTANSQVESSTQIWLNKKMIETASEYKRYDTAGKLFLHMHIDNLLSGDGLIAMQTQKDSAGKETRKVYFRYKTFDAHNNPAEFFLSNEKDGKPDQVIRKIYEYY